MAGATSPSQSGWSSGSRSVALITLVAVAAVGIALVAGNVWSPSGEGPPTDPPVVPTTSPTVAPSGPAVDGLVEVAVEGLVVMELPDRGGVQLGTLPPGQVAMVVEGPVTRGDDEWYLLSGLGLPPNTGCEELFSIADCPGWIGWTAVDPAEAPLVAVEPDCPDLGDYEAYAVLPPLMKLACARGTSVDLTAWWAGRSPYDTCIDSPPGVDWLYCAAALSGWLAPSPDLVGTNFVEVAVDPQSGLVLPEPGRWVEVTGHVDDRAASACSVVPGAAGVVLASWSQVLQCRSTLVVDAMVEVPRTP